MLSLNFNQADMDRILAKLNAALFAAKTFKFKWKIQLLNKYKTVVATAMGSVSGRGGYPVLDFQGVTGIGHWNSLRPYTIRRKMQAMGETNLPKATDELYSQYASKVSIWYDTGESEQSLVVDGNFAGINNPAVVKKLRLMETGGTNDQGYTVKARPLFTAVNFLVMQLIHNACNDPNHPLGQQMRQEFHKLVRAQGWGA